MRSGGCFVAAPSAIRRPTRSCSTRSPPLKGAPRVQVPILLAHGDMDVRVPIVHSEKMVQALKASGKQVEWIPFPGERHGLRQKQSRERFYNALFDFLAKHTSLPAAATAATSAGTAPAARALRLQRKLGERAAVERDEPRPRAFGFGARCRSARRFLRHVGDAPAVSRRIDLDLGGTLAAANASRSWSLASGWRWSSLAATPT
jgi:hypothetical protein